MQWYACTQEISDTRKIFQVSLQIMNFYNFSLTLSFYFLLKTLALKVDLIRSWAQKANSGVKYKVSYNST